MAGLSLFRLSSEADRALRARDYSRAAELYSSALEHPSISAAQRAALLTNFGLACQGLNQIDKAMAAFAEAVRDNPNLAAAQTSLGTVYAQQGRYDLALEHFDAALKLEPQSAIAHTNRGLGLEGLGRLEEAWQELEWRYRIPTAASFYPYRYTKPRWNGEPLDGRTLLVHREQGLGDVIQHLRFLPQLLERFGGPVLFECPQPILPLVTRRLHLHVVPAEARPVSEGLFDCYVPLLSLARILGCKREDLAALCPYVETNGSHANVSNGTAGREGRGISIGVVWSARGAERNVPLGAFLRLLSSDCRLTALQKEVNEAEALVLSAHGIRNAGPDFRHFGDTRDAIISLDAIVAVDTAVAHLAGALSRPVWLLVNDPAPVRWTMHGTSSRWYPTIRIIRRRGEEPWDPLLAAVGTQIRREIGSRG